MKKNRIDGKNKIDIQNSSHSNLSAIFLPPFIIFYHTTICKICQGHFHGNNLAQSYVAFLQVFF